MNFRNLDLNLLVTLDALLRERSTTRAGERIHLSQSAVSGALARLRDVFSDELLVQVGHKMVLTPFAEEIAQPVRETLLAVEAIVNKDRTFEPATANRMFRIMLSDYAATVLMSTVLPRVQQTAPGVRFELLSNVQDPVEAVDQGDVDLLLVARQHSSSMQPTEELFRDDYTCVVWTGNQLVGETLSMDQYLELGHVVVRFGKNQIPSAEEDYFTSLGLERRVEVVAMSFSLVLFLLIGTTRVATVHRRVAEHYSQWLPIRLVPCPMNVPPLVEVMQWHKVRTTDRGIRWLRREIKAAYADRGFHGESRASDV